MCRHVHMEEDITGFWEWSAERTDSKPPALQDCVPELEASTWVVGKAAQSIVFLVMCLRHGLSESRPCVLRGIEEAPHVPSPPRLLMELLLLVKPNQESFWKITNASPTPKLSVHWERPTSTFPGITGMCRFDIIQRGFTFAYSQTLDWRQENRPAWTGYWESR